MTIAIWPVDLPRPDRDTWSAQRTEARRRSQTDAAVPTFRRRFSNSALQVSLSMLLTRNQKAIFDGFYQYETVQGSRLFRMADPTTDGWPLLTSDGQPLLVSGGSDDGKPLLLAATWLCSFGDQSPVETVVGTHFRISFNVVVIP